MKTMATIYRIVLNLARIVLDLATIILDFGIRIMLLFIASVILYKVDLINDPTCTVAEDPMVVWFGLGFGYLIYFIVLVTPTVYQNEKCRI